LDRRVTEMSIPITTAFGYKVVYNQSNRKFELENDQGEEVGRADTQEEAEALAEKMSKGKWDRLPVILWHKLATVTSYNSYKCTGWVTFDGSKRREQFRGDWAEMYPRTPENLKLYEEYEAIDKQIQDLTDRQAKVGRAMTDKLTIQDFEAHALRSKAVVKEPRGEDK
jgi:hypothetical protein